MKKILLFLIRLYQLTLSNLFGGHCRFYPSCSHYAAEAISAKGLKNGIFLALQRILKCQPFHPGGIDLLHE
jgi:uncharacterized protein